MDFTVDEKIFEVFPGLRIVTVTALDLRSNINNEAIDSRLVRSWDVASKASKEYGNPQSHPMIAPWGKMMKAVGAPRKKYPSSIEAMVRRAGKSPEPFRIDPIVDFYNSISLLNLVPAGGFDIDQITDGLSLRFSKDGDKFMALDSSEYESIPEGEVSYADGSEIVTRHFVWKQGKHALLSGDSTNVFFVSEVLGDLPADTAEKTASSFADGLRECFSVDACPVILNKDHRSVDIRS